MTISNDYDKDNNEFCISIIANISELKSVVNITNSSYLVDFTSEKSIGSVLGFDTIISSTYNKSEKIVDITSINSVLLNVDIISGSYVNGNQSQQFILSLQIQFFQDISLVNVQIHQYITHLTDPTLKV